MRRFAVSVVLMVSVLAACKREASTAVPASESAPLQQAPADGEVADLTSYLDALAQAESRLEASTHLGDSRSSRGEALSDQDEADRCQTRCDLAEVICELEGKICALTTDHAGQPRYVEACSRAHKSCTVAAEACRACTG